jgi:(5-formylfuran-3-yl)methyl phosphate synthase
MTGLLVSVRNAAEALVAWKAGADLIDVKEPSNGSLGAAAQDEWHAVRQTIDGGLPISVALGELLKDPIADHAQHCAGYSFAKLGLAGCAKLDGWQSRWSQVLENLPISVAPVAVIYADHRCAESPDPFSILEAAHQLQCAAVLFDTFGKQAGDLFAHLSTETMSTLCQEARDRGLRVVLAGSLGPSKIETALSLAPDYIAVRGAVCRGPRTGTIDGGLVRDLAHLIRLSQETARLTTIRR